MNLRAFGRVREGCHDAPSGARPVRVRREQAIKQQTSLDNATRQAIHLAVVGVNDCEYCQSAYTVAAKQAGWSDVQILEAFADTIRTILTNYFNHLVGTEIDLPLAPGLEE